MRVGNYSVYIPEGVERESGHVQMEHGRQYQLRLVSHDYRQSDATVTIDGKTIGTFRLYGHGSVTLERSPDDNGRFTFYAAGTGDAAAAGEGQIDVPVKGLIQVRFVPERRREKSVEAVRTMSASGPGGQSQGGYESLGPLRMASAGAKCKTSGGMMGLAPGITGLSGHSDQQFHTVAGLDLDEANAVTISLRLVAGNTEPRPLKATGQANKVPDPV